MKKILLAMLLVAAVTAVAQTAPAPAQQPQQKPSQPAAGAQQNPSQPAAGAQQNPSQPAAAPQQKKEIKDPAEYNAYIGALGQQRSEEHTSELQSRENLVCRLLLEKKKKNKIGQMVM